MIDLQLDYDEGIILQEKSATVKSAQARQNREIVLTHKNLCYIHSYKRSVFSRAEAVIEKTSLNDIKIVNGYVQVSMVDKGESDCYLEIQYITKPVEHISFDVENERSEALKWYNAINRVIIGSSYIDVVEPEKPKGIAGMIGTITSNLKSSFGISGKKQNNVFVAPPQPIKTVAYQAPIEQKSEYNRDTRREEPKKSYKNCSMCGERVDMDAKFCARCGESFEKIKLPEREDTFIPPVPKQSSSAAEITGEREQIYDGVVHKCPHCGEILKSFTLVCPACDREIRGVQGARSVMELSRKLEYANSEAQRTSLIKSFPIPNTKEDIFEFLILASTNFDVSCYVAHLDEEDVSDAWLSKIEQCYQKAKFFFENDDFLKVKELYDKIIKNIDLEKNKFANKSRYNTNNGISGAGFKAYGNEPTVDDLKSRILKLESNRKPKGLFGFNKLDPVDSQKLILIKSYPLPENPYEIKEFMVYSISNINIELSKNTFGNRMSKNSGPDTASTIDRSISDAWVEKVQNLYIKAKTTCLDFSDIKYIEEMYLDIMGKLKIKIK